VPIDMRQDAEYRNKAPRDVFPMDSREARAVVGGLVDNRRRHWASAGDASTAPRLSSKA